jgi:hypothetical protein
MTIAIKQTSARAFWELNTKDGGSLAHLFAASQDRG